MLFHSIQIFYVISRDDRKQLIHLQAICVHISGLTCLSHFCCLLFPTGQGRSSVVSGSEVCRNDGGGLRSGYGERCHLEGCPHLVCSGKGPEHLEWSRQESSWEGCWNQTLLHPPATNPKSVQVPYSTAVAGGDEELGEIAPSLNVRIEVLSIPESKNQELKLTGWNFIGISTKFFPMVQLHKGKPTLRAV